ncbi:MAG: fibro-slime domain-containing protein [Christensenellales bacterium]
MKQNFVQEADKYIKTRQRKRKWYRVVTCLAAVVVFCTVYALILPAITMEQEGQCEIPEHTHDISCYVQVTSIPRRVLTCSKETLNIHEHTDECYDEDGEPVCGYADFVVHVHDASCYDENGALWCPLLQIRTHTHNERCFPAEAAGTAAEHVHTEDCFTLTRGALTCTETAGGGHAHGESCYTETTSLVCTIPESDAHQHGEGCYAMVRELTCTLPETQGHEHADSCYAWDKTLTCGQAAEPAEGETPAEPKPICGKKEIILHKHTEECFDHNGTLICGKTQVLEHVHNADCFTTIEEPVDTETLTCELPENEEHQHSALCYGTWVLTCTQEEHTHTPICYADPTADLETAEMWEKTIANAKLTGEWRQDVLAIAETQLGYTESTKNFIIDEEDGTTQKGYTRYGAWYGSPYSDWCAMYVSFCLRYAGVPEEKYPISAGCVSWIEALSQEPYNLYRSARFVNADGDEETYVPTVGDVIFFSYDQNGISDHVGIVAELIPATESTPAQIRTIEGNISNRVRYETYELESPVILGYGLLPEQNFFCGMQGHAHGLECEDSEGQLICGLAEHIHTEACEIPQEEPVTLQFTGPDYTVEVRYGVAALPEGVVLLVEEIPADSEEYQHYYAQSVAAMEVAESEETVIFARFFDIQFQLDGQEIEPAAPVSVTITYAEQVETGEAVNCQAIHFTEEGPELLTVETANPDEDTTSFTHTQNGFSVVGDMVTAPKTVNPTDVGPDALPVDYYVCIDGVWTCVGSTKTGWYNNWDGKEEWTNYNRDYITVEQAVSILEPYGFTGNEDDPSRITAYQQKSGNTNVYCDTSTVEVDGKKILPLSRNNDHAGYNLYYLPGNAAQINGVSSPEKLDKTANSFYTVKVYDAQGKLLTSEIIKTGGSFTYDAAESGVTEWIVAYGNGSTGTISGNNINLSDITSTVTISPKAGDAGSHSVTFKVLVDGQWKTVGSLPYYYYGTVNGENRAYITSDMAAQFFGAYGYEATMAPGYQFGYSYNDIYKIYYAGNTGYCMDVSGNKIANNTAVQLWTSNTSTAQMFRIWDSGEGYCYITPVENSAYHVNVLGGGTTNGTKLGIHTATDAASHWKVVSNSDGTTSFFNKNAPDSAAIDLPNGTVTTGNQLQILANGGYRYWKLQQLFRISNDAASEQNADGTWNIGLTAESNGDIVCYYLPGMQETVTNVAESALTSTSFWDVTVRDDTHSVYSEGELSLMVQTVANEGEATVTVQNADGVLWSCRGVNGQSVEVESTQDDGYTTFVIKNITQPVEVVATRTNPSFTVQYYANIARYATSGSNALKVIDTSGKALPTNGGSMATRSLYLKGTGRNTDQNAGTATELYRVATTTELTKMYTEQVFQYESSPGLAYFNKLKDNESYTLKEIWVLKPGKDAASTNRDDWEIYPYAEDTAFTNEAGQAVGNTILISEGAVIRLVSDTSNGDYHNGTTFYDYNISSGQNDDGRWRTGITGINIESNYGTSRNGQRNWRSGADILAFGNANCGTGMSGYLFDGSTLNRYSSKNSGYDGATFGLASGLNSDGTIRYSEWIVAPKLFNDGDANGKQTYTGSSLTFDRVGDTYTLSAATLNNSNGQSNTLSGLQYFFNPSPTSGTTHTHIFTNNFWPMDPAAGRTDALWGAYGNPGTFQGFVETNDYNWSDLAKDFPVSDDGKAHNWFFGMNFAISFNLTEDYEGPLEYYFFGDDDLWVFLDGQLVCDIGGVHSSIGEYVNLRDYLPVGSKGQHTLSFFYTERGASGSTCWMSFTLPSVSSATTAQDTGSLQIEKKVDSETGDFSGEEYQFMVELLTGENGSALNQTFSYSSNKGTYGTIKSGGTIKMRADESITISGIPAGTFYRVTELSRQGYHVAVNGSEGYIVSGTMETGAVEPASFVNTPYYELPSTGGAGTGTYITGGLLLTAAASVLLLYNHKKRRKEDPASS